jgi:hypothetical protein
MRERNFSKLLNFYDVGKMSLLRCLAIKMFTRNEKGRDATQSNRQGVTLV